MSERHEYSNLWDAVVSERKRQGMTFRELESMTGVNQVVLGRWFRGTNAVPMYRAEQLAEVLGITVHAVVTRRYDDAGVAA